MLTTTCFKFVTWTYEKCHANKPLGNVEGFLNSLFIVNVALVVLILVFGTKADVNRAFSCICCFSASKQYLIKNWKCRSFMETSHRERYCSSNQLR